MSIDVFLSVGKTATAEQEAFVREVERLLLEEGLRPRTLGRDEYSSIQPLRAVEELMDGCRGTVVVALERLYIERAIQRRGSSDEREISASLLPTVWNHIEAGMAYVKRHPLLVIVEKDLLREGLLEPGYDWYVQVLPLDPGAVRTPEAVGRLRDWKRRVEQAPNADRQKLRPTAIRPNEMTIAELVGSLRPAHLWAVLLALGTLVAAAFWAGARL